MKKYIPNFQSFINENKIDNLDENSDYAMAISELNEISKFSQMIMQKLQAGEDIPAWVQSKISVCAEGMNSIYQYMEGKEISGVEERRDGPRQLSVNISGLIKKRDALLKKIDKMDAAIEKYEDELGQEIIDRKSDIRSEISDLRNEWSDVVSDMENDPDVLSNPTDGSNPAVIAYGKEMERIESEIQELQNELSNTSMENDSKLNKMEIKYNQAIDQLDNINSQIQSAWATV